jgi:hypothetical protein
MNPFKDVPFNTKQAYVRGITHQGTEIYLPVDNSDDDAMKIKQNFLQNFLNQQEKPEPLLA